MQTGKRVNEIKIRVDDQLMLELSRLAVKPWSESQRFRYFCGICWKKVKGE